MRLAVLLACAMVAGCERRCECFLDGRSFGFTLPVTSMVDGKGAQSCPAAPVHDTQWHQIQVRCN